MVGFARSGWRNYQEQMCSLQVIISHCWICTKQTYFSLTAKKKISLDNNSLEIKAKSCDFTLNPDQQSHSQMHPTELQCCQYLALAAVAKSKHSLLQLSQQNGSRLCWSRNLPDQCLINTLQTDDFAYIIQVYIMLSNSSLHGIMNISKIQLVVYYQCCVLISWATTRLQKKLCYNPLVAKSAGFLASKNF